MLTKPVQPEYAGSWDFAEIPASAPEREARPQVRSPLGPPPPPGAIIRPKLVLGHIDDPLEQGVDRAEQAMRIQAKLRIGPVDDPLEREADRVAEAVLADGPISGPRASPPASQRECASCGAEAEELSVPRLATVPSVGDPTGAAAPPKVHQVLRMSGQPLDSGTRAYFEQRFGHDFGAVRVHADAKAAESTQSVNALAYTVGHDIVFGAGQYAPAAPGGRGLLAHELSHVLQQQDLGTGGCALQRAVCPGGWRRADDDETVIEAVDKIDKAQQKLFAIVEDPNVDEKVKLEMFYALKSSIAAVKAYIKVIDGQCKGGGGGPMMLAQTTTINPLHVAIAAFGALLFAESARRLSMPEQRAVDRLGQEMSSLATALKKLTEPVNVRRGEPLREPVGPGPIREPIPPIEVAPEPRPREDRRKKDCLEQYPYALTCAEETTMEEKVQDFLIRQGYSFEALGDCEGYTSHGPGVIQECNGAPGETWHCQVNSYFDPIARRRLPGGTVSIFSCLCCRDDGTLGYEWRGEHWSPGS